MPVLTSVVSVEFPVIVPAWSAWSFASGIVLRDSSRGVVLPAGEQSRSRAEIYIRKSGTYTVKALVRCDLLSVGGNDACFRLSANWGAIGGAFNADGSEEISESTVTITGATVYDLTAAVTCVVAADRLLVLEFERNGDNVLDTETTNVLFVGWLIEEA